MKRTNLLIYTLQTTLTVRVNNQKRDQNMHKTALSLQHSSNIVINTAKQG
jgi:hypothetical protein